MTDPYHLGLPEAARRLGVPVRVLRHAMRSGKIPAPANLSATSALPADWIDIVQTAIEASPKALGRGFTQRVPPFARYKGTSAWRKYTRRVREYARFRARAD